MSRPLSLRPRCGEGRLSASLRLTTLLWVVVASAACSDSEAGGAGYGSDRPAGIIASLVVRDPTTGALYDAVGRPLVQGGDRLEPLVGYNQFWFAWSVFQHGSTAYGRSTPVGVAPIEAGDGCAVPCHEIQLGCSGLDCIPALTAPLHVAPSDSTADYLRDNSFVVGVEIDGVARAYPHNILWLHEIVNDVVAGTPVAITHCPLTFSAIGHDPTAFVDGEVAELGVSGRLYNSNLVFYNRRDGSWFSQLLGRGTVGPALGTPTPRTHVWEMSWAAWRTMHPGSTVLSGATGFAREYEKYPYGDYFTDHSNTFGRTRPAPDGLFPNKAVTYGLSVGGVAKAYVHDELSRFAVEEYGADAPLAGVLNDELGGEKIALVFDVHAGYVQAFRRPGDAELELVR